MGYLGERQGVVRMSLLADRSAFLPEIIRLLFCFDMYNPHLKKRIKTTNDTRVNGSVFFLFFAIVFW